MSSPTSLVDVDSISLSLADDANDGTHTFSTFHDSLDAPSANAPEPTFDQFVSEGRPVDLVQRDQKPSKSQLIPSQNLDDSTSDLPSIIALNVGGQLFQTSPHTLLWPGPDSFLAVMLSGRLPATKDATGAYFIDRDPDLFKVILSYLRTRRISMAEEHTHALRLEAEYFGLTELARRLSIVEPSESCGGLLYDSSMGPFDPEDGPVIAMASANSVLAVAHRYVVTCWSYSDATGWVLEQRSATLTTPISCVAITARSSGGGSVMIAVGSQGCCYLWQYRPEIRDARPYSPPARDVRHLEGRRDNNEAPPTATAFQKFDLTSPVADVFFINSNLLAVSKQGRIGVRNARTHVWQVQGVAEICSYAVAGNSLLLGARNGVISLVDLEKFPLRLKDNDLLVSSLYTDPNREAITAMSVYETTLATSERCMEIAYGTAAGSVRVILQHPETVGQAPMLYQTFLVHHHAVTRVVLSERCLISVCDNDNHVRTWQIARFRGRISTQPGSQGVASFSVPTAGPCNVGPYGDLDQQQLFIQQVSFHSTQLLLKLAATGDELCNIESVNNLAITTSYLHEGGMASRVGSRSRRFLCTGHEDGSVQMWDLTPVLDRWAQEEKRRSVHPRDNDGQEAVRRNQRTNRRWSSISLASATSLA
eukprot:TRINITY_DN12498_c1_g7_i6.p1 TRINITY_DN12498_c1_g7~~TRINITY_DN12498_c1_g7_i6.p1  ORF type:complete len:650 (+),score=93.97 TRINITY_DN12498_c1_g7_i6:85-2034(+)